VDSVASITGTMADEPLHFYPVMAADGSLEKLEALGAVPLDVSDSLVARVEVAHASGAIDTLHVSLRYPHQAPSRPAPVATRPSRPSRILARALRRLHVDRQFTRPMDSATVARVEQENELAREIGRKSQETPRLWTLSFLRPRDSKVTSRFGSGRLFNGRVQSSHLGIDYRGSMGEAIHAANRGVVALVANFFLAGNVVYIDHGDGIVTGYFHMSQPEVAVGDTVERGQEIGLVGATGRVTGPHLHWSARFGAITIDPGDLLRLGAPFVSTAATAVSAGSR
jgi:murein DD-endopeptidase MepM/ murein hydrolase activator NlpD